MEIEYNDIAVHFNLACSYSLLENADKAFFHLDKAVNLGFNDFKRIKEHDALAYLRIQKEFDAFEKNGYQFEEKLELPPTPDSPNLLDQLQRLADLREKGLLTEDEFESQKKKLLGD